MLSEDIKVIEDEINGYRGDFLFLNLFELQKDYAYCGLWYAKDGSEKTFITTELYYSKDGNRPSEFSEEIKENSFKQIKRLSISYKYNSLWIATRNDNSSYCKMKLSQHRNESIYIRYNLVKNTSHGIDSFGKGLFKRMVFA